jgi:predicted MPP superfamily phosphohydrolase
MPFPQDIGFLFFRILLPGVIVSLQYMLYRKARRWVREKFPAHPGYVWLAALPFVVYNAAFVILTVFRPALPEIPAWFKYAGAYPFFVWHGATFFIALVVIISAVISSPIRLTAWAVRCIARWRTAHAPAVTVSQPSAAALTRRTFLRRSMYGLTAVSFAGSSYGVVFGRTRAEINRTDIHIANLPSALEGLTIGLISDIHSSAFMPKDDMERYVEAMNRLGTDIIAVTGDFVNSRLEEVYPFAEAFSALRAPLGVFGVLGNHDFFTRQVDKVARVVDDCGVKLLRNDNLTIAKGDGRLILAGIDDVGRGVDATAAMQAALRTAASGVPRILLCHRPYFLPEAAQNDVQLMLSGHTHGGQVSLGSVAGTTIAPAALASSYIWGNYAEQDTQMYVSRGIGTVGLPIRINCPPELTVIRLTSGSPMAARRQGTLTIS